MAAAAGYRQAISPIPLTAGPCPETPFSLVVATISVRVGAVVL